MESSHKLNLDNKKMYSRAGVQKKSKNYVFLIIKMCNYLIRNILIRKQQKKNN